MASRQRILTHDVLPAIVGLALMSVSQGCIDVFEATVPKRDNMLIVESLILDNPDYQYVKLFFQKAEGPREPISTAKVMVHTRNGQTNEFLNFRAGEYRNFLNPLLLAAGDELQLEIQIGDSIRAFSSWEKIPAKVPATSAQMTPRFFTSVNDEGFESTSKGVEVFASTSPIPSREAYFRWTYEVTYGYDAPQASSLCAECGYCYVTEQAEGLSAVSEVLNSPGKALINQSIDFIDIDERFNIRFSVLVKQFNITRSAFNYYTTINQLNEARGSIFDPPPAILAGNMRNSLDPEETVYGFFEVGTYSEVSTTISKPEIPFLIPGFLERCIEESDVEPFRAFDCFDCRSRPGASKVPPYYF